MTPAANTALALLATALAAALPACAPVTLNTTALTSVDVVTMTDQMAQSLAARFADDRAAATPPATAVWTIDRVENRTEQPMTTGEQWLVMARLRAELAQTGFARANNIRFVLPAEQWREHAPGDFSEPDTRLVPTHALRATFHADTVTAAGARGLRADTYLCAFRLVDLDTGFILWEDDFETRYLVRRNQFD